MYDDVKNYLEHQVLSASPEQLIDMLYDKACRDLQAAEEFFKDPSIPNAIPEALKWTIHAQRVISELQRSLDMEKGGELARNLARIYEYMQFRLKNAVQSRSADGVPEVRELLADIHEAWRTSVLGASGSESKDKAKAAGFLVA